MRYRLRTLLIALAVLPPVLAGAWPFIKPIVWPPVPAQPISMDVFAPVRSDLRSIPYDPVTRKRLDGYEPTPAQGSDSN